MEHAVRALGIKSKPLEDFWCSNLSNICDWPTEL